MKRLAQGETGQNEDETVTLTQVRFLAQIFK